MGILDEDMKRVVREQRLGFVATVCPDGTPNLSPKGTAAIWDDDHLVFADLASPATMANLRNNPALELNVVDVFARKGYRFKGTAAIVEPGELFDEIRRAFETGSRGVAQVQLPARAYVLVKVEKALSVVFSRLRARPHGARHSRGVGRTLGHRAPGPHGATGRRGIAERSTSRPEKGPEGVQTSPDPPSWRLRQTIVTTGHLGITPD